MLLPSLCHCLASLETCLPLKTFFFEKMIFHFNGEHHTLETPPLSLMASTLTKMFTHSVLLHSENGHLPTLWYDSTGKTRLKYLA